MSFFVVYEKCIFFVKIWIISLKTKKTLLYVNLKWYFLNIFLKSFAFFRSLPLAFPPPTFCWRHIYPYIFQYIYLSLFVSIYLYLYLSIYLSFFKSVFEFSRWIRQITFFHKFFKTSAAFLDLFFRIFPEISFFSDYGLPWIM